MLKLLFSTYRFEYPCAMHKSFVPHELYWCFALRVPCVLWCPCSIQNGEERKWTRTRLEFLQIETTGKALTLARILLDHVVR